MNNDASNLLLNLLTPRSLVNFSYDISKIFPLSETKFDKNK